MQNPMILEAVTLQDTIDFLNSALALDRTAISALVAARVPCAPELGDHPTIQVWSHDGIRQVGMLGILNGLFGADETGWGAICAVSFADGVIEKFARTRDERKDSSAKERQAL
jgi:hypothetical protein